MQTSRILLTTTYYPPNHVGGDAVHVMYLADQLVQEGHEVHVVYARDVATLKGVHRHAEEAAHDGPELHPVSTELPIVNTALSICAGAKSRLVTRAFELARGLKPDVVHHHNIAGFGPRVLEMPADIRLYTAHDFWAACAKGDLVGRKGNPCDPTNEKWWCALINARPPQLWRLWAGSPLRGIDHVIAPSHFMAGALQHLNKSVPIQVIPNFVPRKVNRRNRVSHGDYILFVGVLEPRKGALQLLENYLRLPRDFGLGLKIVGTGPLKETLTSMIASSGRRNIELPGWVSDRERDVLYGDALATVLPSQTPENCPLVALEALASGSPILATRMGGLPELASSPECSKLLATNLEDLGAAIEYWAFEALPRERARQSARELYERRYSPEVFMKQYSQLLRA